MFFNGKVTEVKHFISCLLKSHRITIPLTVPASFSYKFTPTNLSKQWCAWNYSFFLIILFSLSFFLPVLCLFLSYHMYGIPHLWCCHRLLFFLFYHSFFAIIFTSSSFFFPIILIILFCLSFFLPYSFLQIILFLLSFFLPYLLNRLSFPQSNSINVLATC